MLCLLCFLALFATITAQLFENCDHYKEIQPGVLYTIHSPNYRDPYPPGTFCRYTAVAPSGYQIRFRCTELKMPPSDRCSGDRIQVSRSGDPDLADSDRYCSGPFKTRSFSRRLVAALLSPPQSAGGLYKCELYASKGCDCGRRKQTRIVGGVETGVNEFPCMAGIVSKSTRQLLCGATIIDAHYALTAAHCVNVPGRYPNDTELLVGDHDYQNGSDTSYARRYDILSATRHPDYSEDNDTNDIAVVRVKRSIAFNTAVGPVCLPFRFHDEEAFIERVEALGWGTTSFGGSVSTKLRKVFLDIVNLAQCQDAYADTPITSAQLCTYTPNKDTCAYDSGGPLLFTDRTQQSQILYQVGITSYGQYCAVTPSVSTRVTSYLEWITSVTPYANYCVQ